MQKNIEPPIPPNWKEDTLRKLNFQNFYSLAIVPDLFEIPKTEKVKRRLKGKYNLFFTEDSKVFDKLIKEKYIKPSKEFSIEVKSFENVNLKNGKIGNRMTQLLTFRKLVW